MSNALRAVYVVSKNPLGINYDPRPLASYIDKRDVLKETPKGLRLSISYSDNGTMFLHERYEFFPTYEEALQYLWEESIKVIQELQDRTALHQVFVGVISQEIMSQ